MKFQDFMQQAKNTQEKIQEYYKDFCKIQEDLLKDEYTGYAHHKMVKIVLNGYGEIKSIYINPQILIDHPEMVAELIKTAHNDAKSRLKEIIDNLINIMQAMFTYRGIGKS
jgi:DNA-binding YbaB/EbfC family protein